MAQLGESFDPNAVEPRDNFDPLPPGAYAAEIIESDVKETKAGTGQLVALTLKVTEGPFEGRQLWTNINFRNQNETAQKIGQQQLAELCLACGIRGPLEDTEHLHGAPLRVTVRMQKNDATRNEVTKFAPYDAASAPAPAQQHRAPQQQTARQSAPPLAQNRAATGGGARPWR